MVSEEGKITINCYHCGDECYSNSINLEDKFFCCLGCKTVFEILSTNNLSDYYTLENKPGISMKDKSSNRFDYLENKSVIDNLIDFKNDEISIIQFYIPQIHCSACIWLLENLHQLNNSIRESRVNFLKKEIYLTFSHNEINLKNLVQLLASLGYEPSITLDQLEVKRKAIDKRLLYQVGLAGFAFGNIMLLSLPEYFGLDTYNYELFSSWFGWINLVLATPVAFYSGQDYFKSAWKSIQQKKLNIDVPIALGVFVLYARSSYEVISAIGAGYFDSLCGLLFFLLLGRIFQEKIYHQLSFERDYRSYFPISITKIKQNKQENIPINELKQGDKILIRNEELIPVDAYLIKGNATIDNSFATGESAPITVKLGEKIFAGGKQLGQAIQLEVIRPLNQSKLTRLWNKSIHKDESSSFSSMTDNVSRWFTPAILIIAFFAGIYHLQFSLGKAIEVISAVLIVACPCALALAAPFTFGHATRWLGKQNCYLRDAYVIEQIAKINHLVFDKTGTLTHGKNQAISYTGKNLKKEDEKAIWNLLNQSNHPLSTLIKNQIGQHEIIDVNSFEEIVGMGIRGVIEEKKYRIGSKKWLNITKADTSGTIVFVEINSEVIGSYELANEYRDGLKELLEELKPDFQLSMLSGDNEGQKDMLADLFPKSSFLHFNQSPEDKLFFINTFQKNGDQVMMLGDGLNDAGALKQANVGVAIVEDVNTFSPASDIILKSNCFHNLHKLIRFSKQSKNIVIISFIISFLYNLFGLSLAVQGLLSPVFAAILMPLTSISVVAFVSIAVGLKASKITI